MHTDFIEDREQMQTAMQEKNDGGGFVQFVCHLRAGARLVDTVIIQVRGAVLRSSEQSRAGARRG